MAGNDTERLATPGDSGFHNGPTKEQPPPFRVFSQVTLPPNVSHCDSGSTQVSSLPLLAKLHYRRLFLSLLCLPPSPFLFPHRPGVSLLSEMR